jgi:hypothetical protein
VSTSPTEGLTDRYDDRTLSLTVTR